jgi:FkbM family methyltransferase
MDASTFQSIIQFGLGKSRKILHVGANRGQELQLYQDQSIEGYHIEAIPAVFDLLNRRCTKFSNQHAINACLSDVVGEEIEFNVSSNGGLSSSILPLGRHGTAHPNVAYTSTVRLHSKTIDSLVTEGLIPKDIDFLALDVQGAEMLVLKGGGDLLASAQLKAAYIKFPMNFLTQVELPLISSAIF